MSLRYVRPDGFPPIVKNLIIINVLVYIAQVTLDRQYQLTEILKLNPIIPPQLHFYLSEYMNYTDADRFRPYQVFTHMFAHAAWGPGGQLVIFHILFNMFTLWMFGRVLENFWGAKRFLIFYLACGIGAAALHLGILYIRADQLLTAIEQNDLAGITRNRGALAGAIGASGAIMGVFAAFAYLFPNTELMFLFIPFPIKAKWLVLGLVALDLFGGIARVEDDNIAHFAHLGGAITGFIIVYIWNKTNRKTFY
jgi:membrane associated rhomboid family serine protease